MSHRDDSRATRRVVFGLLAAGTVLGIAGTDLVLPAVPALPMALGGDASQAQLVLAAYVAGTVAGLLGFAAAGDRFTARGLLVFSMLAFGAASLACAAAPDITTLTLLRFLQGATASAPAVFAPGILKRLSGEAGAIRSIGLLGSVESLTPALAPIAGAWLLGFQGWRGSFEVTGALALCLAAALLRLGRAIPVPDSRPPGSYLRLLADPGFLKYALSQAFVLGGLLVFVFGAPTVLVRGLGGTLGDFIRMQVIGIATFIIAANLSSRVVARWGAGRVIAAGTGLALLSSAGILAYGLGGRDPLVVALLFIPMNIGLGLRGPPGFVAALKAAGHDDARGSALVVLAVLGTAALGTAAVAPFILDGLPVLAGAAVLIQALAVLVLRVMPGRP